jgi:hypothetical protein
MAGFELTLYGRFGVTPEALLWNGRHSRRSGRFELAARREIRGRRGCSLLSRCMFLLAADNNLIQPLPMEITRRWCVAKNMQR